MTAKSDPMLDGDLESSHSTRPPSLLFYLLGLDGDLGSPLAGEAARPPDWLSYLLFYLMGFVSGGLMVGALLH